METLKTYGNWRLNKHSQLKYFKNGRANMHVKITYCIEYDNVGVWKQLGEPAEFEQVDTGMFWIQTKKEALHEWKRFTETHTLGGCSLKAELFPMVSHE